MIKKIFHKVGFTGVSLILIATGVVLVLIFGRMYRVPDSVIVWSAFCITTGFAFLLFILTARTEGILQYLTGGVGLFLLVVSIFLLIRGSLLLLPFQ